MLHSFSGPVLFRERCFGKGLLCRELVQTFLGPARVYRVSSRYFDILETSYSPGSHGFTNRNYFELEGECIPQIRCYFPERPIQTKRMISMREGHTSDRSFELSLLIRRICGSTTAADPRDSIFALLGLVRSKMRLEIQADYYLNITEVFTKAVKHSCSEGNLLQILALVATYPTGELQATLPSWVPSFNSLLHGTGRFHNLSYSQLVEMVQNQHFIHALSLMT